MISIRFVALLSTFFLVTGALLVGDALHGSVVTNQYPVTSPAAVFRAAAGLVCIAVGSWLQTPASEYTSLPSEEAQGTEGGDAAEGEFDPEMSPLSEEEFEDLDRDEGR